MNKIEFDKVVNLSQFLWRQVDEVKKKGTKQELWKFSEPDKHLWDEHFKELILSNVLPDGTSFGTPNNDTNMGIGKDGASLPCEYYQLLMQCYRYLYMALSSGEIFLKSDFWSAVEK